MNDLDFEHDKVNRSADDEVYYPIAHSRDTLSEKLTEQLRLLNLNEKLYILGEEIIGKLDADGYLKRAREDIVEELNMFEHLDISKEESETLLKKIQRFDPVGIAARNLQECLLIQLRAGNFDAYYKYLADELLSNCYIDFTRKRYDLIKQKLNLTEESLRATLNIIPNLNPEPGEGNAEILGMNQISPDVLI